MSDILIKCTPLPPSERSLNRILLQWFANGCIDFTCSTMGKIIWGFCYWIVPVWPDWAIYWTLGNFLKPFATNNLPKSPTFLGIFCKCVKIFNFSSVINFGQLLQTFGNFFLVTLNSALPTPLHPVPSHPTHRYFLTPRNCPHCKTISPFHIAPRSMNITEQGDSFIELFF